MSTSKPIESEIEAAFVAYAEARGCQALKLRIDGQNGFPDRTVLMPDRRVLFFEFKRPGGKLRPMQRVWWMTLESLGHRVHAPESFSEAKEIFNAELLEVEP